jgi:hypothetical protein
VTPRRVWERLATFGLALALGSLAPVASAGPQASAARQPQVQTIYHRNRAFKIPFKVEAEDLPRLSEVELWVSDDSGFTWKPVSRTTPDHPWFTYRAARDAEFWFAVRTRDKAGKLHPGADESVEPNMKVIVDSTPPSLILEPDNRRGSRVGVRWEVRDEHLDLKSFSLEYQAEGARDWGKVGIARRGMLGTEIWEAGTAGALKVRGSISDLAGNKTEETIILGEGTPGNPGLGSADPDDSPPPISQISSSSEYPTPGPGRRRPVDSRTFAAPPAVLPHTGNPPGEYGPDAFGDPGNAPPQGQEPIRDAGAGGGAGGGQTLLVPSPQFALQYAVEDAGPNGPASVELWVTQDGGRTWYRRGEDADRVSPFVVDLGGEGTFGLCLVARAASGLGDAPPAPGDPPQSWVEVDSSPPRVQLDPVQVGSGPHLGKVAIRWRANDPHLGAQPVSIAWRADQPGANWQAVVGRIENSGQFIWTVPPNIPPRFHLRVDVVDTVGNRGSAETPEGSPVIVDRTRPRSRILGLDPSAHNGRSSAPVAGSGSVLPR